ncbi:MAG: UTP--glucose-1-phosphate uridylyltransferase GalU [Acidimicrobiia bacterium]|nr:UTP--glucose-1-phosphate uridylyltransferase GalU [Acidimicrobiia bacterium]MDX2468507.1 UTP--glucose-1-phosphate uridylyltransferase GalU [Acidimicrobiia bacterium]
MKPVRKAIFPVGGLGTRFLPATKAIPKEMLPVVDKPLIEYAVEEARSAGIEEFIFVTGRGKSAIEDHFDNHYELEQTLRERGKEDELAMLEASKLEPGQVVYVRQMSPLGLGHAVWCARNLINDEPFAVLLADDLIKADKPTLREMVEVYEQEGGNVVSLMEVPDDHTSRYGIVDPGEMRGQLVEIKGLVEKPDPVDAPSNLAIVGRYILQPSIMTHLGQGTAGAGNEIQLTDSMLEMIGDSPFNGLRLSGTRFDCGTKAGFLEAGLAYGLARDDLAPNLRERLLAVFES